MDWRIHSFKYNLYLRTSSLDSRFRNSICLLKSILGCLMGFSNISKTELLAFPPPHLLYPPSSPLSVSLAKKYSIFFDSSLSLTSHLQSVSKFFAPSFKIYFKNWPRFSSTLVPVTFLSLLDCCLLIGFPSSMHATLQFIFSTAATVKNLRQMMSLLYAKLCTDFPSPLL